MKFKPFETLILIAMAIGLAYLVVQAIPLISVALQASETIKAINVFA